MELRPYPPGPDIRTQEGRATLIARGDEIRAAIDRYHGVHGRYPKSLSEAGVRLMKSDMAFGGWKYTQTENGAGYYLKIGRYVRSGFILERHHFDTRWGWDT